MSDYGKSIKELYVWAEKHVPVLGNHFYLLYLKKAEHPCSYQMFAETLKHTYSPSLMGYDFKQRKPNYDKFYQKLAVKLYFDHCINTLQPMTYETYSKYSTTVSTLFDYPIPLITEGNFRRKRSELNRRKTTQ